TFPGVHRARAELLLRDGGRLLPRPGVRLIVDADVELARLRAFIDAGRDPNLPLRLVPATPVAVRLTAVVDVLDDHGQQATLRAARAALSGQPAPDGMLGLFARLGFGDSVALSAVYATLQRVVGVRDVLVVTFEPKPPSGSKPPEGGAPR